MVLKFLFESLSGHFIVIHILSLMVGKVLHSLSPVSWPVPGNQAIPTHEYPIFQWENTEYSDNNHKHLYIVEDAIWPP